MKTLGLIVLLVGTFVSSNAFATAAAKLRHRVEVFKYSVPDQQVFQDYVSEIDDDDDEEKREEDEERQKTINSLKILIKKRGDAVQKFEHFDRLSTLYEERYVYLRDAAIADYLREYDKWVLSPDDRKEPQLSLNEARTELIKRVNILREIHGKFKNHPKAVEMTFALATVMGRLEMENCEFFFKQILKRGAKTKYFARAKFGLGEYYFAIGRHKKAVVLYNEAIKTKDKIVKPYATYKLGWAYYMQTLERKLKKKKKTELQHKAVTAFKLAVLYSKESEKEVKFNLADEAVRDLAWFWALSNKETDAKAFFTKQKLPAGMGVFNQKLAADYAARGDHGKFIKMQEKAIAASPEDMQIPTYYSRLVYAYSSAEMASKAVETVKTMGKVVTDDDLPWLDKYEDDDDVVKHAVEQYRSVLKGCAGQLLFAADKQKNKKKKAEFLAAVVELYAIYFKEHKEGKNDYNTRFNHATALYMKESYPKAVEAYDVVIKLNPKDGQHLKSSLYNKVMIVSELDSKQKYPKLPAAGEIKKPMEVPEMKKKLESAVDAFVKLDAKDKDVPAMRYTVADNYFQYGHYKVAIEKFEKLGFEFPRTPEGRASIEKQLGFLLKKKRWDELIEVSTKYLNTRAVKGRKLREHIKENLTYAKYMKKGGGKGKDKK